MFFYKYLRGHANVSFNDEVQFVTHWPGLRSADAAMYLNSKYARTESRKCSYIHKIGRIWNSLPGDLKCSSTVAMFKSNLHK